MVEINMSSEDRRKYIRPGMPGSWGVGAERSWDCEFYPERNGCECAGGGLTEEECRTCFYRTPLGDKRNKNK